MSIPGLITEDEVEALGIAAQLLGNVARLPSLHDPIEARPTSESGVEASVIPDDPVALDCSVLDLPASHDDIRVCLDFGTAMSKATLVSEFDGREDIRVLELGIPGDQEEISDLMLVSSVYIDNQGNLLFGKAAVDMSLEEGLDGSRQRMDNIKRRISEDGLEDVVPPAANPSGIRITYEDVVLSYLVFLTWASNRAMGFEIPTNVQRRFAIPCFAEEKRRDVVRKLKRLLGEAQILADTFKATLPGGIPVKTFVAAKESLRRKQLAYPFIREDVTEPLGVAGSILSWRSRADILVMVVDVGAGTSDFSLYRLVVDPENGVNSAHELRNSARAITEAGNYLDSLLVELILKKAGVTSDNQNWASIRTKLELRKRDFKESLFNEQFLFVPLAPDAEDVEIKLADFMELAGVKNFEASLRATAEEILMQIDDSIIGWIKANPRRNLTVMLTGGGARLPMVKRLAEGSFEVHGTNIPVVPALSFPKWLEEEYPELEDYFGRIAVSLGGARKRIINRGAAISVTAGDITKPGKLEGYYVKGS